MQRLRELGWIEGRTVAIEYRWAEGATSAMPRSRPSSSGSRSMSSSRSARRRPGRQAGDIDHPDRLRAGGRPGRQRPGRSSGAAGRQRHRPVDPVDRSCRQAARTLARGRSRSAPVGDHGQCRPSQRRAGDARGRRQRPARSASRSSPRKSGAPRISRPPSTRSRAAPMPLYVAADPLVDHQPRSHQHLGARRAAADDARHSRVRRGGRPDVLWHATSGSVSPRRRLCRQDSARGKAGRPAGRAADQVRTGRQPDHRQGARPRRAARRCSPAPTR